MKIWLIKTGEPLPTEETKRLMRMGMIAQAAVKRGHEVILWTSSFDHLRRNHRFAEDTDIQIEPSYRVKTLKSFGYRRNVSVDRMIDHYLLGKKFYRTARKMVPPDIILCALPTIDFCYSATRYGKRHGVPVVMDLRDMWPDVFVEPFPEWMKSAATWLIKPFAKRMQMACRNATAMFGITDSYLEWGLNYAGRNRAAYDSVFYHAYKPRTISASDKTNAQDFWRSLGVSEDSRNFLICFFGLFGRIQFNFQPIVEAAKILINEAPEIKFVLCGTGDQWQSVKESAAGLPNIIFPGYVDPSQVWTLMDLSKVGLAPYRNIKNFTTNLPNKVSEYLAGGLPILTSLEGELRQFVLTENCGVTYQESDPHSLAQIVLGLRENEKGLCAMSKNAVKIFSEKFNADIVFENMIDRLEEIQDHYRKADKPSEIWRQSPQKVTA